MARQPAAHPGCKPRWVCRSSTPGPDGRRRICYTTTNPNAPAIQSGTAKEVKEKVFRRKLAAGQQRFIIVAAQNATPVHKNFFASLLTARKELQAELLVVPIRYRNPTSIWSGAQEDNEWWAPEVTPYLWSERLRLNQNLTLLADVKVVSTASEPLRGFDAITHGESGILGHTKLQMKVVPAPSNRFPKILSTTGACTKPNYSDSKAGALGKFHHSLSAIIIELDGKKFHLRHVHGNRETGEFTDLTRRYSPFGVKAAPRPEALIMGDTHVDYIDALVMKATFHKDGIIDTLKPKMLVWHDVLDSYAVNPHHQKNPFLLAKKQELGLGNVIAEILRCVSFVETYTTKGMESLIVVSNHNDFVDRYMKTVDWKQDLPNARFYFETGAYLLANSKINQHGFSMPSPFEYWFKKFPSARKNIRVLRSGETISRVGVELALHGDVGPGGSRGSAHNLRRIGIRSIIGHSHSPCISEGCYQVGTSTSLRLEYNEGPSAWLNTHCILHADGKRQLITIIDGAWRI